MDLSAEAKVRAKLTALRAALEERGQESDTAKRGRLGAMQHQVRPSTVDTQRAADLLKIDTAMARLDEGKYGYCAICGNSIEDRRLEADPATIHCAKCGGDQQ